MQLQVIEVKNFKSLVDFRLDLAKFSCLIGLNGAGKSTVLQLIDFIGQQVRGKIDTWLAEREWEAEELLSKLALKRTVEFAVSLVADTGEAGAIWKAIFDVDKLHCIAEHISTPGATLDVEDGHVRMLDLTVASDKREQLNESIAFSYQGSILSQLDEARLPKPLLSFKNYFGTVRSLELLSPKSLRERTRDWHGGLGLAGQGLTSIVEEIGTGKQQELIQALKAIYPQLTGLSSRPLRGGWRQIEVSEAYPGKPSGFFPPMTTEAHHVNDGMLRLIAILAELTTRDRFVLFDEIENGINPEVVQFVIDKLVSASQQVLVTTHSPMILNYLDDKIAKSGVIYLYKTARGHTKSIPFFSIPSLAKKLTVMGPGEAFVDTNLIELAKEIAELRGEET